MDGVCFLSFFEGTLVNADWNGTGINRPFHIQRVRREISAWKSFLLAIMGQKQPQNGKCSSHRVQPHCGKH